jgi:uncharacterized protein YqeY
MNARKNVMLEKCLRDDLKKAQFAKDEKAKETLRMVLGELPRLNKKAGEKVTDEEIIKIITNLIKSETIVLEYSGIDTSKSRFINILSGYLPQMMTATEISKWIDDNVDVTAWPNKMAAMGPIMAQLKGKADGSLVKKVLLDK